RPLRPRHVPPRRPPPPPPPRPRLALGPAPRRRVHPTRRATPPSKLSPQPRPTSKRSHRQNSTPATPTRPPATPSKQEHQQPQEDTTSGRRESPGLTPRAPKRVRSLLRNSGRVSQQHADVLLRGIPAAAQ